MWTYDVTHYMVVNFDVIIALASMACVFVGHIITSYILYERFLTNILIEKWKLIVYVIRGQLFQNVYFVYVVEVFITLNWEAWYKYMSSLSSLQLLRIHVFSL